MPTWSSSPPIHVRIDSVRPVHMNVKSERVIPASPSQGKTKVNRRNIHSTAKVAWIPPGKASTWNASYKREGKAKVNTGNLHSTAKVEMRVSCTPTGKTSTRNTSFKWEGPTHCLQIAPPLPPTPQPEPEHSQIVLQLSDLTSEEEEGFHGRISKFERRVDSLITDVSSLKNEAELRKKKQLLERQAEQLSVSQQMIMKQGEELTKVTKELEKTGRENTRLHQFIEKMLEDDDYNRQDGGDMQQDKDTLHRKLLEAKLHGTAAAKQVFALQESFSKLCGAIGTRPSDSGSSVLAHQKELLQQELETLEATNQSLQHLLRELCSSQLNVMVSQEEQQPEETAELRKKKQLLERQAEQLSVSQQMIMKQGEELTKVTKELEKTGRENTRLHQFIEKMLEDNDYNRQDGGDMQQDKDTLHRKLLEAKLHGTAAVKQVFALRESFSKLCGAIGTRPSGSESSVLAHQKELLLRELETLEVTNQSLRHLLRELCSSQLNVMVSQEEQQPEETMESIGVSEQKDALLKRLAVTEAENTHLVVKLQEKDREVTQLSNLVEIQKDNAKSTADLSKSLESTRAHLQAQLRSKEAHNNRLTVQIKNLEQAANQQKVEMERVTEQLVRLRQQASADQEALNQATQTMQAQKQRAEHSKLTAGQLKTQLLDMEWQLTIARSEAETWQSRHAREEKDKTKLELELSLLNSRIAELTQQLQITGDKGRAEREALLDRMHALTTESTAAKLENQSLKATASTVEEKLTLSQSELQQVKASIQGYENLLDSYKIQVGKSQTKADEYCAQLAKAEQETQVVRGELQQEIEEVRKEMLRWMAELEPPPKSLQHSELQLQEAQDKERNQKRCSTELSTTLTDHRMKVETQGSQAELLRQKNKMLLEENRQLQQQVESLERELQDAGGHNSDLLVANTKQANTIHSNHLSLETKTRECSLLKEALCDARQQISETRGCSTQSKILDQEAFEINHLRPSKEQVEWRYQSQMQDVMDRLEQTDSDNQSLQNYIQFLKASYRNVLGDPLLQPSDNPSVSVVL